MKATSKSLSLLIVFLTINLMAQSQKSFFPETKNVGDPAISGKMVFNPESQVYEMTGSGINIWADKDQFFYAARKVSGDFILTSKVEIATKTGDAHRKMGLMIRQSMDPSSPYADIILHSDGLLSLQYRSKVGATTEEVKFTESGAQYLQLEKKGSKILARIAQSEQALTAAKEIELPFEAPFYVGLATCSHNPALSVTGLFSNVRFDVAAAEGVDGYKNQSPSRLEILDIESGNRKVIYSTTGHIEAPNWSRDGKFLIYNSGGKLYKFDLAKGTPEVINTGIAINNNNDHGISFDGKMLAVSNAVEENGKNYSIVFTLPIEGGTPFRVTEKGPSYWHGWSPDGKTLTYCAERNGDYDVYQNSVKGGQEKQLTTSPGLDDGPEYAPDGKTIYFNSTRTGMMQIWKMNTDGTNQQQVTFDNYQNWFAHSSPNGKSIMYISYPSEVPATSHPHNQRVMLRMQAVDGKEVKVKAHIYGGQGTFNVPSWSPDSKKIAFVSYTYGELE
ncbi:MAG TPA: biopolymer transporter TolR [Prolixibacteraceae bacterium]|jgi:Tol biopolymer transport system component|nr:biopolymer transporter TolR [Prolixibacteraceae bacterium]